MMTPLPDDSPDIAALWDLREAALGIIRLTRGNSPDAFAADAELIVSVERGVHIIGRTAHGLTAEVRASRPHVPWRQFIGAARIVADEDDALDADELWRLVELLPALVRAVSPLLPEDDDLP